MKCPYLSEASKKICVKMLELKLKGEVSDFDIKHYCTGNPIFCYYFRLPQIKNELERKKPKIIFEGEIPKPKQEVKQLKVDPEKVIIKERIKPRIVE
ncbi:hypothetical protein DRO54_06255 [Candidatus Bathyarchaeota archaeon]|nr:MAG: hypothetical protein DRO54_06255 [Candidatus Bathyarchaeota archaeon]